MGTLERLLATYLVNAAWVPFLVAGLTALAARVLRRSPAAHRNQLWTAALALAALAPLAALRGGSGHLSSGRGAEPPHPWRDALHVELALEPQALSLVAFLYGGALFWRALTLFRACRRARSIVRAAGPPDLTPRQEELVDRLAPFLAHRLWIATSPEVGSPVVFGIRRPILILPDGFAGRSSEEEFAAALWHELAHARRHDCLVNLVCEVLLLPLFFHPAARFLKAQVERSRELACDEFAAERLPSPTAYARSILSIARRIATRSAPRWASAVGLFEADLLEERIASLLERGARRDGGGTPPPSLVASCLCLAACLSVLFVSVHLGAANERAGNAAPVSVPEAKCSEEPPPVEATVEGSRPTTPNATEGGSRSLPPKP